MSFFLHATGALERLVDWFIPPAIAADKDKRKQARLFLISHLVGPFIGNTVPLALFIFDPTPHWDIAVLAISITGFWVFPFVLRSIGHYNTLAIISIQNLMFCILWSCYFYGGVTSPTLPWVLTIPLLAFFYIGNSAPMRLIVLGMFVVNVTLFGLAYSFITPPHVGIALVAMQWLGLISTIAAALYVTMMAVFYARALASQKELESVIRGHLATAEELRIAAITAERAGVAKAEFLARMSHELRTPLNAVIGYSQMLLEDAVEDDQETIGDLHKIMGAGQHLLDLVNDVLDLSKIEAGRMELFTETLRFATLVSEVVEQSRLVAQKKGLQVDLTIDASIGSIVGDAGKIQNVIGQIVRNAVKYTDQGSVRIDCKWGRWNSRDMVVVGVADTGIGIAAEFLPSLFEQFAVGDDQTSTKYGGARLGLALTHKLCRLMGGHVEVRTAPGVGSCFTIFIPANAQDRADAAMTDRKPHPVRARAGLRFVHA